MNKPISQRPSQPQVRYLRERLRRVEWDHRATMGKDECPEPPAVVAARKIIKSWENSARKSFYAKQEQRRKAINAAMAEAERAMLFSSPDGALKAVDAFAAKKF